jgi:HlyD family secretion protein
VSAGVQLVYPAGQRTADSGQLQVSVLSNEAQVSEQINNLRNICLALEQNRLSLKSQLVDMEYNITRLERFVERRKELAAKKMIPQADYINAEDELVYYDNRRDIIIESQQPDEQMRLAQGDALEESVTRTREGQGGEFTLDGHADPLQITRVYPQVTNGQFEVDLEFVGTPPNDIRRGQKPQTHVQLGDASGDFVLKRNVRLGRRNAEYLEVLECLAAGEQVITSEYPAYATMARIQFN